MGEYQERLHLKIRNDMKKYAIFTVIITVLTHYLQAQCTTAKEDFRWDASAPPASPTYAKTYAAVGSNASALSVSITGNTMFQSSTDPSTTTNGISLPVNWTTPSEFITVVVTFSPAVKDLMFRVRDIDRSTVASGGIYGYVDETVISAALSGVSKNVVVTSGNSAASISGSGTTAATVTGAAAENGKYVDVTIGGSVDQITLVYRNNLATTQANPNNQSINIGNFCWYPDAILPVVLSSISGVQEQDNLILNWATSAETNSESFDIQRSSDAISFENIGQTKAAGNSADQQLYTFRDKNPFNGVNYYRLKQNDFDGSYEYSRIIPVEYIRGGVYYSFRQILTDEIIVETNATDPCFELYSLSGLNITNSVEQLDKQSYRLRLYPQQHQNLLIFRLKTQGKILTEKFFVNNP
jgi:hypothetical protein